MSKTNWKTQLEPAQIVKEFSAINFLDINQTGNELLVTSNSRISMYNVNNLSSRKTFNAGGSVQVFGANFRKTDYKLFTSSTKDGKLNIYDINNNKALRTIEGDAKTKHNRAVRHSLFYGVSNIVSFDPRSNSIEPLHKYDHGAQVECVIMKNSLVISAGEKMLKVYDLISGKLVFSLENIHSKSITSIVNYENYLLTASLDGHVKVFDTNFKMLHSISYTPAQLMTVCVNKRALVVGGNDGLINVRKIGERKEMVCVWRSPVEMKKA